MAQQKTIEQVITDMVNAGESDEDIDAVVQDMKASQQAKPPKYGWLGASNAQAMADPRMDAIRQQDAAGATRFSEMGWPTIAGGIGAAFGGPPGAAIGGATGSALRDMLRANEGAPDTPSGPGAALNVVGDAAMQGALTKGTQKAGELIINRAVPFVRSAIKAPYAELRRRAGIEGDTPNGVANAQARFIIQNKMTKPEQARKMVSETGAKIDQIAAKAEADPNVSPVLDIGNRIPEYLTRLMRRVDGQPRPGRAPIGGQLLPRQNRTAIQNTAAELVNDSPLSQRVPSTTRPVPPNVATIEGLQSRPLGAPAPPEPSARPRAIRANVQPSEMIATLREKSFFDKDASAASQAAGRQIERASRDSLKASVPELGPVLKQQGRAMDAEKLLDRANWLQSNRDQLGFEGVMGAANGRVPTGLLLKLFKEGQLKMGVHAPEIGAFTANLDQPARLLLDMLMRQRSGQ